MKKETILYPWMVPSLREWRIVFMFHSLSSDEQLYLTVSMSHEMMPSQIECTALAETSEQVSDIWRRLSRQAQEVISSYTSQQV